MKRPWQQQRERSSHFWIGVLVTIGRWLGPWPVYAVLHPVVAYFYLTGADARAASRDYLRRVLGRPVTGADVYRHLYTFARVSADRMFFLSGKVDHYRIDVDGEEVFQQVLAGNRGGLLLVSHLGSFDAMRVLGVKDQSLPLRIVLDRGQNPAVGDVIDRLDPDLAAGIIDAGQSSAALVLKMDECLKGGELVGIMADRASPNESVVRTQFLGDSAAFPAGPWTLAGVLKVPVILCFGIYLGRNHYRLHFELMSEGLSHPRKERGAAISQNVQHYAGRLRHFAQEAPYNWFNFYDFWAE